MFGYQNATHGLRVFHWFSCQAGQNAQNMHIVNKTALH